MAITGHELRLRRIKDAINDAAPDGSIYNAAIVKNAMAAGIAAAFNETWEAIDELKMMIGRPSAEHLASLSRLHAVVCEVGHYSFSGDREHHHTLKSFGETCRCGSTRLKIACPPGCINEDRIPVPF